MLDVRNVIGEFWGDIIDGKYASIELMSNIIVGMKKTNFLFEVRLIGFMIDG